MNIGVAVVAVENREAIQESLKIVRTLEDYGFASVWLSDVVVCPPRYADLAYEMEIMTFASFLAAKINTLTLGTSALILPQRNPAIVAKQAATIDNITDGNFILGVGAGWRKREMSFLGSDPKQRGQRMEEYITLIRRLWRQQTVTHKGNFVNLRNATIGIRPVRKDGPPIWVGGNSRAAEERAKRLADAWHPQNMGPDQLRPRARHFFSDARNKTCSMTLRVGIDFRTGRPGAWAQVFGNPEHVAKELSEFSEMGLSHLVLVLGWDVKTIAKNVRRFGERVLPKLNRMGKT